MYYGANQSLVAVIYIYIYIHTHTHIYIYVCYIYIYVKYYKQYFIIMECSHLSVSG